MSRCIAFTSLLALVIACSADEAKRTDGPAEKDWKSVAPADVGVAFVSPKTDKKTGFNVGGKNTTASIRKLTEINGRLIADLESDMRPGAMRRTDKDFFEGSGKGFLGRDEKLLEVMARDNEQVVDKWGLTHQELARHLILVTAIAQAAKGSPFVYHGRRYKVEIIAYKGFQESPFFDDTRASMDATVTNVTSGASIRYSFLVPLMIERYGFYEGKGTPYRVEPSQVLEVFDFLKK